MEKIDKELLRHYLEHGGDAGVRERLREWFLEHDAEEEFTLREDDPVSGELYAFWGRSLQRSAPQRTLDERYRALAGRLFGRKLRLQRLWRRLSQAAAVLLLPLRLRPVRATARPLPRHPPLPLPTVRSFWPRPALRASSAPSLLLLPLTRMSST